MQPSTLDNDLAGLALQSRAQLRQKWEALTGRPAPRVSAALMRLALAFELQANAYGGLSQRSVQRLTKAASAHTQDKPCSRRLVREWKGQLHIVLIDGDGTISWDGRTWRSLSEVARAITGTRWSGPAFFGLKERRKSA